MKRRITATIAALAITVTVAACGGTTVVHKSPAAEQSTTATNGQNLMDLVIAKNPDLPVKVCKIRDVLGDQTARLQFAQGYGKPQGGVSGVDFYDYLVEEYC